MANSEATARTPQRRDALRIASMAVAGWGAADRMPGVGDEVQCVDGVAEVIRILGRTSDGSRLLELKLRGRPSPPYFAAASNVLQRCGEVVEDTPSNEMIPSTPVDLIT